MFAVLLLSTWLVCFVTPVPVQRLPVPSQIAIWAPFVTAPNFFFSYTSYPSTVQRPLNLPYLPLNDSSVTGSVKWTLTKNGVLNLTTVNPNKFITIRVIDNFASPSLSEYYLPLNSPTYQCSGAANITSTIVSIHVSNSTLEVASQVELWQNGGIVIRYHSTTNVASSATASVTFPNGCVKSFTPVSGMSYYFPPNNVRHAYDAAAENSEYSPYCWEYMATDGAVCGSTPWAGVVPCPSNRSCTFNFTADFTTMNGNPNGRYVYGAIPSFPPIEGRVMLFDTSVKPSVFSISGNVVGFWSTLFFSHGVPAVWTMPHFQHGIPRGELALHPGCDTFPRATVIGWRAFEKRFFTLNGTFGVGDTGTVEGRVYLDTTQLFGAVVSSTAQTFSVQGMVRPGSMLWIVVDLNDDCFSDSTPIDAVLTLFPPTQIESMSTSLTNELSTVDRTASTVSSSVTLFVPSISRSSSFAVSSSHTVSTSMPSVLHSRSFTLSETSSLMMSGTISTNSSRTASLVRTSTFSLFGDRLSRTLSVLGTDTTTPIIGTVSSTVTFTSSHSASSPLSHSSTTTPTPTMSRSISRSVDLVIVSYTLPVAAKAAQATATSAAILSLGSGGDAATPTTLALLSTVNCEVRGGDGVMLTVAAKAVSVFGEYGFVAMGLINLGLLLGISGLHFIVVVVAACWKFGGESWLAVSGERGFRFPLLSVVLGEFLLPPAVFGAVAALVSSRSPTSLEVAGAAAVLVVTALWVAGREAVVHRFILSHVTLHTYSADLVKYFLNARTSVLRVLLRPVLPTLYWEPRALRISHGALFTRQRSCDNVKLGGCDLWLALLTATLAVVAAVVDRAMCSVVTAVLGAAYLAFMLYCVAVRPSRLPHDAVIAPVTYFCFCVMCILKLIVPLVPSGVDNSAIQTVDTVIGVLLSVSMVLRSVLSVAMIHVEKLVFDTVSASTVPQLNHFSLGGDIADCSTPPVEDLVQDGLTLQPLLSAGDDDDGAWTTDLQCGAVTRALEHTERWDADVELTSRPADPYEYFMNVDNDV